MKTRQHIGIALVLGFLVSSPLSAFAEAKTLTAEATYITEEGDVRGVVSSIEKMEADRKNKLAWTNDLLVNFINAYAAASSDEETQKIQGEIFSTLYEATLANGGSPTTMTTEQAVFQFQDTMRKATIARLMSRMDVKPLFALGRNPHASIEIPAVTGEMMRTGQITKEKSTVPLSFKEREALAAHALQRLKWNLEFHEASRKLLVEKMRVEKAVAERRFVDAVLRGNGMDSEVHLKSLQDLKRPDGTPAFDSTEVQHWSDFIDKVKQNAQKPGRVPDPKVLSKYWDQIERAILARGLNNSTYPLPEIVAIEADLNLTQAWRDMLIDAIRREQEARMQYWSSEDASNSAAKFKK